MYAAGTHLNLLSTLTTKEMIQREDETSLLLYDTYRIELANHKIDSGSQFYLAAAPRALTGCRRVVSLKFGSD